MCVRASTQKGCKSELSWIINFMQRKVYCCCWFCFSFNQRSGGGWCRRFLRRYTQAKKASCIKRELSWNILWNGEKNLRWICVVCCSNFPQEQQIFAFALNPPHSTHQPAIISLWLYHEPIIYGITRHGEKGFFFSFLGGSSRRKFKM